jgi:plasmid stabilization system protein ParE
LKKAVFTPEAAQDVEQAFLHYENAREHLGARFLDRLKQTVERIERIPEGSPMIVADVRRAPILRQFKDYSLWYRSRQDDVLVIGCLSGRRSAQVAKTRAKTIDLLP